MDDSVLRKAHGIILEELAQAGCVVRRVLLFGSRARGEAQPQSDWDFYVLIDQDLPFPQREDLASRICWRLAQQEIFADLFIQSEKTALARKTDPGYLTYYAFQEGIEL